MIEGSTYIIQSFDESTKIQTFLPDNGVEIVKSKVFTVNEKKLVRKKNISMLTIC